MGKYSPLGKFLKASGRERIEMPFKDIERILGSTLPHSARVHRAWWANHAGHIQARDGWLAAGYRVEHVDLEGRVVCFVRSEAKNHLRKEGKRITLDYRSFEDFARKVMSQYFGVELMPRKKENWPKCFDLVSPDYKIVGDVKYFSMVRGKRIPPAKFSNISEHVFFLEHIDAERRFLVFGNDIRVPQEWLKHYKHVVKSVEFYFLHSDGRLEKLYPNNSHPT